jgi:hypothetical protein
MATNSRWKRIPAFARKHQLACFGKRLEPESYTPGHELTDNLNDAHVVTSRAAGAENLHRPILDIDFGASLIPSTTPGHFHLYLDKEIPWDAYEELLKALGRAGVLEQGYVDASIAREYTSVRLPWIKKKAQQARQEVTL